MRWAELTKSQVGSTKALCIVSSIGQVGIGIRCRFSLMAMWIVCWSRSMEVMLMESIRRWRHIWENGSARRTGGLQRRMMVLRIISTEPVASYHEEGNVKPCKNFSFHAHFKIATEGSLRFFWRNNCLSTGILAWPKRWGGIGQNSKAISGFSVFCWSLWDLFSTTENINLIHGGEAFIYWKTLYVQQTRICTTSNTRKYIQRKRLPLLLINRCPGSVSRRSCLDYSNHRRNSNRRNTPQTPRATRRLIRIRSPPSRHQGIPKIKIRSRQGDLGILIRLGSDRTQAAIITFSSCSPSTYIHHQILNNQRYEGKDGRMGDDMSSHRAGSMSKTWEICASKSIGDVLRPC